MSRSGCRFRERQQASDMPKAAAELGYKQNYAHIILSEVAFALSLSAGDHA